MIGFEEAVTLVSTVGFPIFVAVWMLYYGKKYKKKLDESMNELKTEVKLLRETVKSKKGE